MNTRLGKSRREQRGTTLIETLVALVVLSIGLLGVAALQMTSLRNNRGAHLRSQAAVLAYDIADRMRANRTAALGGAYTVAMAAIPVGTALNDLDIQAWKQSLSITLPAGDGSIGLEGGNVVVITVQWTDTLEGETANAGVQTFTTRTRI